MTTDVKQIAELVQFTLILLGQIAWMVYCDWTLSIICGVILPLAVYPVLRFGRRLKKVSRKSQEKMAEVADRLGVSKPTVMGWLNCENGDPDSAVIPPSMWFRLPKSGYIRIREAAVIKLMGSD